MDPAERQPLLPTVESRADPLAAFKLVNVFVLGISFMFVFAAFQTTAMIQGVVLDSLRNESGGVFSGDGYTSLGIIYGSFAICNWFAPPVVCLLGSKWSMIVGVVVYNFYVSTFLYLSTPILYAASALVGAGAAVVWTAQGNFLTINSSAATMTRDAGIFWALLQCSTIFGNLLVYFEFKGLTTIGYHTRTTVFSGLTVTCFVGMLCMLILRTAQTGLMEEVAGRRMTAKQRIVESLSSSVRLIRSRQMLLLCTLFAYTGLILTFLGGVFVTSVGHTSQFGKHAKDLVGVCGIMTGVGEMLGGLLFGLLGNRATRFGRSSAVLLGYVLQLVALYLTFLDLSEDSPVEESEEPSYMSNPAVVISCSLLLGLGDSCINSQLYSLLGVVYAADSSAAFSIFKFMQALAATAGFFYSEVLVLWLQLLILLVGGTVGVLSFIAVETSLRRREASETSLHGGGIFE